MGDGLEDHSQYQICHTGCAGVVYLILAVLCKSITKEDCLLLPKGEKIARLLRL